MLKGRFPPSGRIEGFTAEIGASGSYCPQHATLPVEVTYFDIAEHSAPSPFLVRGSCRGEAGAEERGGDTERPIPSLRLGWGAWFRPALAWEGWAEALGLRLARGPTGGYHPTVSRRGRWGCALPALPLLASPLGAVCRILGTP